MASIVDRSVTRRASRLLVVVAVLLGLLAMHGVASAHHAVATTNGASHTAAPPVHGPAGEAAHKHPVMPHNAVGGASVNAAVTAPAGPSCDDDCSSVAALCVAVLAGAACALLLARRRAAPQLLTPARRPAPTPAPPVRHARGPDPVRELCVNRT